MGRGKKKFALIWWIASSEKDVIDLSLIPKSNRKIDSVFQLTWRNLQTKQNIKAEAKLLAISGK